MPSEDQPSPSKLGELQQILQQVLQLTQPSEMPEVIRLCRAALELVGHDSQPELWAWLQFQLGSSYVQNPLGDRAENLERAIGHLERALEIYTRQDFPEQWAAIHNNLALAYWDRVGEDRAQSLEAAIRHYERTLEVYTRRSVPERWAMIQNDLANVCSHRIRGDRAQNLERAIGHLEQALEVYTREDFPQDWAMTRNNLANAYSDRLRGRKAQNLEEAIRHYERALEVYTREDFPQDWAAIQNNLAAAYWDRIEGNRAHNLERAVEHYEQALVIRTRQNFPQDCRNTAYGLANLLYEESRFTEARKAFTTAHEAVEALRGETQREEATRELAEENALLYAHLVHCCLLEDDEEAAFEYAAAGKGRAFVDLLATVRFDPSGAGAEEPQLAEDLRRVKELRQQIGNMLAQLSPDYGAPGSSSIPTAQREKMRAEMRGRQEEYDALWEEMTFRYPALTATQQAPTFTVDEARGLAEDLGATLVEYYGHAGGWCAFVVTPDTLQHVPLPSVDGDLLERMSNWLKWTESDQGFGPLSYTPLRRLHQALIEPLRPYLPPGEAVVVAPFGELHLLPLGAALDPANGRYAAEDFRLSFAPSLAALRVALDQAQRGDIATDQPMTGHMLSVAYPGVPGTDRYLPNALPEAEAVASHFEQVTPLYEDDATPDAVLSRARGRGVVHLVCHGSFDSDDPEQSGLELAGGYLTVQRIITELRLNQTRLATLSACESSRLEVRQAEEHVGLLQAVISAGAWAVVAGLWKVEDTATQVLFEAFYTGIAASEAPADALRNAAKQVRSHNEWEHPYYWAAFQVSGLAHDPDGARGPARPATG